MMLFALLMFCALSSLASPPLPRPTLDVMSGDVEQDALRLPPTTVNGIASFLPLGAFRKFMKMSKRACDSRLDPNVLAGVYLSTYDFNAVLAEAVNDRVPITVLRVLVDRGAFVNSSDALSTAARWGRNDTVRALIDLGVDVNADNNRAFRYAARRNHVSTMRILMNHGANPADFDNEAIRYAAENGHLEAVEYLVTLPEVDPRTSDDAAFKNAVINNNVDVARVLILHGADVQVLMNEPVRQCAVRGYPEMLQMLIEYGANVHDFDDEALRLAASNGFAEVVKVLF